MNQSNGNESKKKSRLWLDHFLMGGILGMSFLSHFLKRLRRNMFGKAKIDSFILGINLFGSTKFNFFAPLRLNP